jgi:site-specific recombinase XerD
VQAALPTPHPLLSECDVQRLLLATSERAASGVRNRALIALLYCSGVRLAEALALCPADLELAASTLRIGGPNARRAHLFAPAQPYLEAWLALRARRGLAYAAPVFCTLAGDALAPSYVRLVFARLARRAGIGKRVHPHLLRVSSAARMAHSGVASSALCNQLGLASERALRRTLAARGLQTSGDGRSSVQALPWSLAPEPGAVRVRVDLPRATLPAPEAIARGAVVVRRWEPPPI